MDGGLISVHSLHIYPVKSCAGVELEAATVALTGFDLDRTWMVVDAAGEALTQRELPGMALVRPTLKSSEMVLRAPGMLALHVALDSYEKASSASLFGERLQVCDMGDLSAAWFSRFLGREARLVRFDPAERRLSDRAWTGELEVENAFQDGFPLLVCSLSSLHLLNQRRAGQGGEGLTMTRFRPNIVLDGLEPHGEDGLHEIAFGTGDGAIRLRLVKPCARCPIPDVDPLSGNRDDAVSPVLASYRADPRLGGKVTFGMNAVILAGVDRDLRRGAAGAATIAFD